MCVDILNRGESVGDGIYDIDPDGVGDEYLSKEAYCDMGNGGWTLYDSFGTELKQKGIPNPESFNAKNINTKSATIAAGYNVCFDQVNTTVNGYHTEPSFMQWHQGYESKGFMKKTLPTWANQGIRVDTSNEWSSSIGKQAIYYNSILVNEINAKTTYQIYEINKSTSGMELKLEEIGMFWIDSVWVK